MINRYFSRKKSSERKQQQNVKNNKRNFHCRMNDMKQNRERKKIHILEKQFKKKIKRRRRMCEIE